MSYFESRDSSPEKKFYNIIFQSDDRSSGTISRPVFRLGSKLRLKEGDKIVLGYAMSGYKNINSVFGNGIVIDSVTYTVDEGYYNIASLKQAYELVWNGPHPNLQINYNNITDRITISNNVNFTLDTTDNQTTKLLGFNNGNYTASTSYTAQNPPNLYELLLYVTSNIYDCVYRHVDNALEYNPNVPERTITHLFLERFTPEYNFGYTDNNPIMIGQTKDFNEIWFELRDRHNRIIPMDNHYSITLNIETK